MDARDEYVRWHDADMPDQLREAVRAVASRCGLPPARPRLLRAGSNTLLRLEPLPVVARVATVTALVRPGVAAWLARDIALARHVHDAGVPVALPCAGDLAGPHHQDGFDLSLWQYVEHRPDAPVDPGLFAGKLAELHAALAGFPGAADARGPVGDIRHCLALVDAPASLSADVDRLADELARFPVRPLHGDAHPGNVLVTPTGLVWNDFEDSWSGPLGWDLACMARSTRFDGAAAVAAYPGTVDPVELAVCTELRELLIVAWYQVLATVRPSAAPDAARLLATWLTAR